MTRSKQPFVAFGFASTHAALDAEALLQDMGVDVVPVPAPSALSSRCGIALRVPVDQEERAERFLANGGLEPVARLELDDY